MGDHEQEARELTLDPEDWAHFRTVAHAALDEAIEFLRTARERPVWRPTPDSIRAALSEPIPLAGQSLESICREFQQHILPYGVGNTHPRFFGWVHGSGQAGGVVAEMLAAAMNCNCGGRDHVAIHLEKVVTRWCLDLFGFPEEARGLLVSGTSMANLIGLGAARNSFAPGAMRAEGLHGRPRRLLTYASAEAHGSVVKAAEVLGLGASSVVKIPVDECFRIRPDLLRSAIAADRLAGHEPLCVVGCAGSVNTGAIDDLKELADICARESLWFHVDGAFGALAIMSPRLKPRLEGIERADSIGFDFHKWLHVPYDAGCILVRRGDLLKSAYSMRPVYLRQAQRGLGAGEDWPCEFGLELSRGFRALKTWFALKEHGIVRLSELIEQNCAQAQHLAERIRLERDLELLAPVGLNIVCFRVRPDGVDVSSLDQLNEDVTAKLQETGVAAPSTTHISGKLAIRVNITNHRTRRADLDLLVDAALSAGRELSLEIAGGAGRRHS